MTEVEKFVEKLSAVTMPDVFNPYRDTCSVFDIEGAPGIRKLNLINLLYAAQRRKVKSIWVARDLGYRGGRRTGLALTDEFHLPKNSSMFEGISLKRATAGPIVKERTASIIWDMIARIGEPIFMWNAFPFHPHLPLQPMSNRCHKVSERMHTNWVLERVLDLLQPEKVYAIGGDAKRCLENMAIQTIAFRHPSYGGQAEFAFQVEQEYNIRSTEFSNSTQLKQMELF